MNIFQGVRKLGCGLGIVLLLLGGSGCDSQDSPVAAISGNAGGGKEVPDDPGPGNLAGIVVGTMNQQPLTGLTVSVGAHTTTTNAAGEFRLVGVGEGRLVVKLSDESIYPRSAVIDTAVQGRSVELDAIERDSEFNLAFYRELARGNHPTENNMFPLFRWTSKAPPTFYIDTNGSATDTGTISLELIERVRQVITTILPIFSGNTYQAPVIRTRHFSQYDFEAVPEQAIVLSFDDSLYAQGAVGVTFTQPTLNSDSSGALQKAWIFVLSHQTLYAAAGISREEIIAHELGHAFGFRHTSVLPSVMVKAGAYGNLFSEHDRRHMAVVYRRPAGNVDIDDDVLFSANALKHFPSKFIFIDRRPDLPQTLPGVIQRVQLLQGLTHDLLLGADELQEH